MRLFQAALDTCLGSPFFASLSVHGLHFTFYAPSKTPECREGNAHPQKTRHTHPHRIGLRTHFPKWAAAKGGLRGVWPPFFPAIFARFCLFLFPEARRAPGKSRKRKKKATFLRDTRICLNPHLCIPICSTPTNWFPASRIHTHVTISERFPCFSL